MKGSYADRIQEQWKLLIILMMKKSLEYLAVIMQVSFGLKKGS